MGASFHIENFGCRAARADGEAIADRLHASGMSESHAALADVVVVNTCSVTAEADRAARAFIRRAHRMNPDARIVATGCYAQRAPAELAALGGVAAVVGNSHKAFAPEIALNLANQTALKGLDRATQRGTGIRIDQAIGKGTGFSPCIDLPGSSRALAPEGLVSGAAIFETPSSIVTIQSLLASANSPATFVDDRFAHSFLEEAQVLPGAQTRPNLKIQEGCGNRCTFCVIPQTRGSSRSFPPKESCGRCKASSPPAAMSWYFRESTSAAGAATSPQPLQGTPRSPDWSASSLSRLAFPSPPKFHRTDGLGL